MQLRKATGVLQARAKAGVRFKVRSADELIDKIREVANDLGILIYPGEARGAGHVVEAGTLADVTLVVVAQAIEDGSWISFAGYGLGSDTQDKAGGKAGTYAFKQALVQALLAGGSENAKKLGVHDTDDTDTPIPGGVRPPVKPKAPNGEQLISRLNAATTHDEYRAVVQLLMTASPDTQLSARDAVVAAKARVNGAG